jgi:hypothetical protein
VIGTVIRAAMTVALFFAVVIVLTSPSVVYGEAQPLELSTRSETAAANVRGASDAGHIYYLSVVHERRAPWDVLADVVGSHDASAPRVAASPGPDSASGDGLSRQAAIDAWQAAQRDALGAVQTTRPPAWPAVGHLHGDSAGLAYLLRYLDMLLPGDVTGGMNVAATGVVSADGTIQPIGGLEEKLGAARSAGVKVAFVPALNDLDAVPNTDAHDDGFEIAIRSKGLWPWQPAVVATAPYAAAGAASQGQSGMTVVAVSEPADVLAWLCGRTSDPAPCEGAATLLANAGG